MLLQPLVCVRWGCARGSETSICCVSLKRKLSLSDHPCAGRGLAAASQVQQDLEAVSPCLPQGGIMGIEIYWDCNLDGWFHHCRPKYSFRRLDDKTTNESLYPGYNFR